MKKIIFTLVMGMTVTLACSQNYHKLIRTNTFWDDYFVILPEMCYTSAERVFFTNQDTVINGLTYKISKQQNILQVNPGPFCPPFVVDSNSNITYQFLREDTLARKVYIYTPDYYGGSDQLFYDFSLLPGDTLKSAYSGNGLTLVLDTIVDFLLGNGETRKKFNFGPYGEQLYYIEGIGGANGLLQPLWWFEEFGGYFCVKENSVDLIGDQCDYPYVGQHEVNEEQVSIYPNPANGYVNIFVPQNYQGSDFRLMNLLGEEVFRHDLNTGSNTFSVSDIIPGVYFYQVQSNKLSYNGNITIY